MNVKELKEQLSKFDDRMRVFIEGDLDVAGEVQVMDSQYGAVIIRGAFSFGSEPDKKL